MTCENHRLLALSVSATLEIHVNINDKFSEEKKCKTIVKFYLFSYLLIATSV